MAKIYGIKITKGTVVSGVPVEIGDELFVPGDISEDDARTLLRMANRATEIKAPEIETDEALTPPADDPNTPPVDNTELLKLLDKTVPEIEAELRERVDEQPLISNEEISVLLRAEQDGNTRTGVINAIKAELKSRGLEKDGLFKKLFSF